MDFHCRNCKVNVEEVGGSQMNGCDHFLCANCIVRAVKNSDGLETGITCGCQEGNGIIDLEELEFMVPAHVYGEYLSRISEENARKLEAEDTQIHHDEQESSQLGAASLQCQRKADSKGTNQSPFQERYELQLAPEDNENDGWIHVALLFKELMETEDMSYPETVDYVDTLPILENLKPISCPICLDDEIPVGHGVILKKCCHQFCKTCLARHIEESTAAAVKCPFVKDEYNCSELLKPKEIKALVSKAEYERHFDQLALKEAEETMPNVFHCLTPDCKGFCIAEPTARRFRCPLCNVRNCISCKAIHSDTCEQYWHEIELAEQRRLKNFMDENNRAEQRRNDQLSEAEIQRRVSNRIWMRCPRCNVVIEKNGGCPHMRCRKCNFEFNWSGTV
ncbi:RanBP-type and C3HC4-type zinc finger-containing protein 1 [Orchesella cincta]|uniref:RanBP-type and C3HC4-type zinc finger-containing protein 1 n=1 Tax=Orchesella cincta TaxID=48709 RepID=A0A1D2MLC1_ORCCI|nr:RanBP-type and C3HC4-type zinc finger-containing protein 1 [Orchesella cincta]